MAKTIPRNVKKAFLISSYMGSVLKYHKEGTTKLLALHKRINNGMNRYALVAGGKEYFNLAKSGEDIWVKLSERHKTTLTKEETEIFIELLGYVLSPKDYKDFLAMEQYKTAVRTTDEIYARMCESVLDLNDEVNELLGTKSCAHALIKPKAEKIKKQRDKAVKKVSEGKVSRNKRKEAERKAKARSFLRDVVAKAKGDEDV